MTDSHSHLTSPQIKPHLPGLLKSFIEAGGKAILDVAYSPESIEEVVRLKQDLSGQPVKIKSAIGLHPELFNFNSDFNPTFTQYDSALKQIEQFEKCVEENLEQVDAIGETGLDYHKIVEDQTVAFEDRERCVEIQKISFRRHVQLGIKHTLPLTIHTRDKIGEPSRSAQDAIQIICEEGTRSSGAFHSFTGEKEMLDQILSIGFYVGFNGIITYPKAESVRELLKATPIERVLLETDLPYLPPQSVRSDKKAPFKWGKPADIMEIAKTAAEVKGIELSRLLSITTENFYALFGE